MVALSTNGFKVWQFAPMQWVAIEARMRTEKDLVDIRTGGRDRGRWFNDNSDRGAGELKCVICEGPLADHEIGDHATRVVERMLKLGFPTPVSGRLP